MAKHRHHGTEHHPDGRPAKRAGRRAEPDDRTSARPADGADAEDAQMSSAMGGTSDAGTAADDASEAAAFDIGLPDDRTKRHGPGEEGQP